MATIEEVLEHSVYNKKLIPAIARLLHTKMEDICIKYNTLNAQYFPDHEEERHMLTERLADFLNIESLHKYCTPLAIGNLENFVVHVNIIADHVQHFVNLMNMNLSQEVYEQKVLDFTQKYNADDRNASQLEKYSILELDMDRIIAQQLPKHADIRSSFTHTHKRKRVASPSKPSSVERFPSS